MSTKNEFQMSLFVLILGAILLVSTNTQVNARSGSGEVEVTHFASMQNEGGVLPEDEIIDGGPGFIMVSAFDFIPISSSDLRAFEGTNLYNPGPNYPAVYIAGLTLPHNTQIRKLTLYYKDSHEALNMSLQLVQVSVGGIADSIAEFWTDDSDLSFRFFSIDISDLTVNNQINSYYLSLRINPSDPNSDPENVLLVSSVRIDYAYINSVPLVMK